MLDNDTTTEIQAAGSPASKKQKVNNWRLKFDQTAPLRMLMDIIHNLITRVQVQVVKSEDFSGIIIESVDTKRVCLICAKLECEVVSDSSGCLDEFCVDTQTISTCLRSIASHYSVDIYNCGDEISMISYEVLSCTYTSHFKLPTLIHDAEKISLDDLDYDHIVEIDLVTIRGIVKNCLALKGDTITILVQAPVSGDATQKMVTIISKGNATQEHKFYSSTDSIDGEMGKKVIRTTQDVNVNTIGDTPMKELYNETFSAAYLNLFMKSMERQVLEMKLTKGMPLIITYPLGADGSSIRFVLAAKLTE